jgi:hypothetical protein
MRIIDRAKRLVSVAEFENNVEPIELSKIEVKCPYGTQYILRMCISEDGETLHIPDELQWMKSLLIEALTHQQNVVNVDKKYCYITVRHGYVKSVTDDEWHVDGFSTKVSHVPEQNYIWSNRIPTEYTNVSVKFPDDFYPKVHNVNYFLQDNISEEVRVCKENVLYCLDPYVLHRRPVESTNKVRTFVRISFVPIMIDDMNNTQNPLLPQSYTGDGVSFRNTLKKYETVEKIVV